MTLTVIQSIILGIVQGITEFLPISSSGHLVLTPFLFGWKIPANQAFAFDVLVQVATLVAVFTYFWQDLIAIFWATLRGILEKRPFSTPEARLGWYLILATIPAATIGVIIRVAVENAFESPYAVAIFLLVTAVLLLIAERVGRHNRPMESLNWRDALTMGFFQILALFPGISRSGATITGGMIQNLERPTAARFSFMMSIPVMLAAGLLATVDMMRIPHVASFLPSFIPGFITSAVVGYLAIHWLLSFLNRHPLHVFAIYCAILGLISLALVIF
ncbi:MAG TPA: undecaprenyl-diphosphatase UppP [Anaerolineales bacterium]|jgi:undecaprenyl-diphosphatase|nr:undecaprenyl-diphosphatase UppP [Anaerolineales bacterium]